MKGFIRQMVETDIPECVSMAIESFGDKYPAIQFNTIEQEFKISFSSDWWGRPKYFVYESDGIILGMAGYVLSWLDWDTFEFFWLNVRSGHGNKGIGKMLTKHLESEVLNDSAFKPDITIMFSCERSVIKYHEKQGYEIVLEKAGGKEVIMGKTFVKT
jgi:GNAT superfamily N-acetyltransferase